MIFKVKIKKLLKMNLRLNFYYNTNNKMIELKIY